MLSFPAVLPGHRPRDAGGRAPPPGTRDTRRHAAPAAATATSPSTLTEMTREGGRKKELAAGVAEWETAEETQRPLGGLGRGRQPSAAATAHARAARRAGGGDHWRRPASIALAASKDLFT